MTLSGIYQHGFGFIGAPAEVIHITQISFSGVIIDHKDPFRKRTI